MIERSQTLIRESGPMGPEEIRAPAGNFDRTAIEAWYWLLAYSRRNDFKTVREKLTNEAKIEALSIVLANSIGMAAFYWTQQAREY